MKLDARTSKAAAALDLDEAVAVILSQMEQEELLKRLQERFEELPPQQQVAKFLQYLPDGKLTSWLETQHERLQRMTDPTAAVTELIAEGRRTLSLDMRLIPEGTRVELQMFCAASLHAAGNAPGGLLTGYADRTVVATKEKNGLRLLRDVIASHYVGACYDLPYGLFQIGTHQVIDFGDQLVPVLHFNVEVHFRGDEIHPFDTFVSDDVQLFMGRCLLNGQDVFCESRPQSPPGKVHKEATPKVTVAPFATVTSDPTLTIFYPRVFVQPRPPALPFARGPCAQ